jgi:hypothetical protein
MKIAVFTRDGAELCPFFESNTFCVFVRDDMGFRIEREETFERFTPDTPNALRRSVSALLPLISDCGVIAGGALSGIAFTVFDRAGLHIFELTELSDETLFGVLSDVDSVRDSAALREKILRDARPVETENDGVYYLDLVMLQTKCPEISSKKAMRDFMETTPFSELHLICRHIPPWIECDEELIIDARPKGEDIYAVISKRSC